MHRSFATQFRKFLQQSILFILTLNFLFIGSSSYAIDLTDKEPPSLQSIKIVNGGSTSDLYVLEIVTKDDKNWVSIEDRSFYFYYKDDLPVCSYYDGHIFYSTDEVSRETNSNGAKIQKFYLSFVAPPLKLPNCPKFSVSKFEFTDRISQPAAFLPIRDQAGRVSKIPIISKVLESPLILNKDFFQRFTMPNFWVDLRVGHLSSAPLTSKDKQNATDEAIKSYTQFILLIDTYKQISGNSDLIFSRDFDDDLIGTGTNKKSTITWDQSRMREELVQWLDDNLRLRDFQNSKSLTDLLKLRMYAPVSEKELLEIRINSSMMAAWNYFRGQPGFVDEVTTQIRKAETKPAADAKAAAELKAAELKAKQDAEAKAIADKAAAEANRREQTISVSPFISGPIPLSASGLLIKVSSTSNLSVFAYNSTNNVCEFAIGLIKTKTSGRCVIAFSQEGNSEFKPATNFILDFSIVSAAKKTTITCVKGKLTKKVTAVKPVCPAGYKKK